MLKLKDEGYGIEKGIPTMLIAACAFDDVLAISFFSVFLVRVQESDSSNVVLEFLRGPLELIVGIIGGSALGWIFGKITIKVLLNREVSRNMNTLMMILCLIQGFTLVFLSKYLGFPGFGVIAAMVFGLLVSSTWNSILPKTLEFTNESFSQLWNFLLKPLLFALIGASISISFLSGDTVPLALLLLIISVIFRCLTSILSVFGTTLVLKEKMFVAIAWLPKATVQAAIGSVALDNAISDDASDLAIQRGETVLTVAVLSIFLTAPLGAFGIDFLGRNWLQKISSDKELNDMADLIVGDVEASPS
jgi:NhaP-type Na+/H+ or K+/H+ antiporter